MVATLAPLFGVCTNNQAALWRRLLLSSFLPFFFDDLDDDQNETEGLGRSDADREIIWQWEPKEPLISCSDRSVKLTCEFRLTEFKQTRWRGDVAADVGPHLHSETAPCESFSLLLSVYRLLSCSCFFCIQTQWRR